MWKKTKNDEIFTRCIRHNYMTFIYSLNKRFVSKHVHTTAWVPINT